MKKLLLLFVSMFAILGTSMAQDKGEENGALTLLYQSPGNGKSVFTVNYVQLEFNKDVEVTLPEGGIVVKNNTTDGIYRLTRLSDNQYLPKNLVILMFEQKSVTDKDGKEELVDQYIYEPGDYSYTIPAGCIRSLDGEEFAEQTFTFKVVSPLAIESISPDYYNGTTKLEKIEITFDKAISKVEMPASGLVVVDNYWTPVANVKKDVTFSDDRKTVILELETPVTTPGTYNLDIDQGIFNSEDGGTNEYTSLAFNVIDPTPSFATNFKEGERLKEIGNLEITFKNVNEIKFVEGADAVVVYMPGDGEATGTATLENKKITVTFDQKFTEEGIYTFVVPAGMFTMDGVENEEYSVSVELYTFEITPLEIVSVTPAAGTVNQIDKVIVKFNQTVTLSMDENWQTISYEINLTSEDKVYKLTYCPSSYNLTDEIEYLVNAHWTGYEYESTPITETGKYTLNLSDVVVDYAGESYIDEWGYPNTRWNGKNGSCEGTCTWTIEDTGIEEVKSENGDAKAIYDLTGRRIENITNAGIYIVGGKKVIVK